MPDLKSTLEAIGTANKARSDIWTALQPAEYQLTHNSSSPNMSVVRVALEIALEACDRTQAAIETAQCAAGQFSDLKFD